MRVAIIGRPNVGKSTLFNRLVGKRAALVDDTPGVTRDWQLHAASLGDLHFDLIDTAGQIGFEDEDLFNKITQQNKKILHLTDVILFMVDAREGVIASDLDLALQLLKQDTPVILVANKCESPSVVSHLAEFYKLGLGDPIGISAAHGLGFEDLYTALRNTFQSLESKGHKHETTKLPEKPLNLAIVGRPNAGKSTLINALIGEERLVTGHKPGITRDAVTVPFTYNKRHLQLVDTAGMRKRGKVEANLEKLANKEALLAIRFAEVVILVLDAECPLEKQDLHIADHVVQEGRALVIAINKMDLARESIVKGVREKLENTLSQVRDVPCIPVSALTRRNLNKLMNAVFKIEELWNARIPTAALNRWLSETTERHPTPLVGSNRIRIKYMTQVKTRPPTFALFTSKPAKLPESYVRFLANDLRKAFSLPGVPLRLMMRKGKNPYTPSS